jgi:hypothetical protein
MNIWALGVGLFQPRTTRLGLHHRLGPAPPGRDVANPLNSATARFLAHPATSSDPTETAAIGLRDDQNR